MLRAITTGILLIGATSASANFITGTLDDTDPVWDGCGLGSAVDCAYDAIEFIVDTSGLYTFDAFYPGDASADENLDGIIEIYEAAFDPLLVGLNSIAFDDDGPGGSNTSQIADLNLSAGTDYFLVVSSFTDVPNSFGQPLGPWEVTASSNAGNVTFNSAPNDVPAPSVLWLLGAGLLGAGVIRRRLGETA